jgi:hypothetical protein
VIGVPMVLAASLYVLGPAGLLIESRDSLYGEYRTDDGKAATVNVFPVAYFHYRDTAGRCIDFWPMLEKTTEMLAAGHDCGDWGHGEQWLAVRNADKSITLEHPDGTAITIRRQPVPGRFNGRVMAYRLPAAP